MKKGAVKLKRKKNKAVKRIEREDKRTRIWEKYRDIARHLAGKFSRQYRFPYRQLMPVAEYALALELYGRKSYRKKHGTKKSTWLYSVVFFHLKQVCTRGKHPCPNYPGAMKVSVREWAPEVSFSCVTEEDAKGMDPPFALPPVDRIIAELSSEAQALVLTVLRAPEELAELMIPRRSPKHLKTARDAIKAYLIDEFDWTSAMVDRAWSEVQGALTTSWSDEVSS